MRSFFANKFLLPIFSCFLILSFCDGLFSVESHYSRLNPIFGKVSQKSYFQKNKQQVTVTVSEVISGGQYLILTDNSVWKINPDDIPVAGGWIGPGKISVMKSQSHEYPYLLFNALSEDSIHAAKSSLDDIKAATEAKKEKLRLEQEEIQKKELKNKELKEGKTE